MVPLGQYELQKNCPGRAEKEPASHWVHTEEEVAPKIPEAVPAGQKLQKVEPLAFEKDPAPHKTQAALELAPGLGL